MKYADIAAVMLNEKKSENLIHELYSNMILFILAYMSFTLSCLNLNIFSCLLSTIKFYCVVDMFLRCFTYVQRNKKSWTTLKVIDTKMVLVLTFYKNLFNQN